MPMAAIFMNQLDATTVALDAATGKEFWKVKQGDYKNGQTMTSAPMVVKDKVISGISGGEFGVRGFVTANDIKTGKQIWRMYSTGPKPKSGLPEPTMRRAGRAMNGSVAAAPHGAGTATIPNSTSSITGRETRDRGIRTSGPATTNGR